MSDDFLLVAVPRLDGLMELRDAVVALNGPLAEDPAVQENLHRQLFNEERRTRVLGRISAVSAQDTRQIPFG
ncbi:putative component of type VI protein secretion system [Pseudomonas sp. PvP125]